MAAKKEVKRDPAKDRKRLGANQKEFWGRIGVTQSGGSRYEGGRKMPNPTQMLYDIVYGTPAQRTEVFKKLAIKEEENATAAR